MATNFPTGSDNFTTPNSPGSTALSSSGTGSRNHVQFHRDTGDAIEAMQAEATLAIHSHDGTTFRHGSKLSQSSTHESPDTDSSTAAIHHTLGHSASQAAPGNHASLPAFADTHGGAVAWPVGCIYISTSSSNPSGALGGTWVQVQDAFLIGAGGAYSYTGSVVSNATTHSHTVPDTSSDGSHIHTLPSPSDSQGSHTHTSGPSGGTNVSHSHSSVGSGYVTSNSSIEADSSTDAGGGPDSNQAHTHTLTNDATYSSGESFHTHTISNYASAGAHTHTVGSVSGSTHSHSVSTDTPAHVPTWRAFYVWRRTA